ncbi:MAG: hypothetical protein Q8O67_08950 [Deltaproteobacteria bacterium]|nr:hypothetical protein [Deltaproteobacteria bacterium]
MIARALVVVVLASLVAHAAPPDPKTPKARKLVLPALQVMTTDAVDVAISVNGFSTAALIVDRSNDDGMVRGFDTKMLWYSLLHPYFLKSGNNVVDARYGLKPDYDDDMSSRPFGFRVVAIRYDAALDDQWSTQWPTQELLRFSAPPLKKPVAPPKTARASFSWTTPLPVWSWTKGKKIDVDTKTKDSLYAAAQVFWKTLAAQTTTTTAERASFAAGLKASTREYAQASELHGPKYTFVDVLLTAATTLDLPGAPTREQLREMARKASAEPSDVEVKTDTPAPIDPAVYDKPHLTLDPLPPAAELTLEVFGDGRLARLHAKPDGSLIEFGSNYPDGNWGATGSVKVACDVWFRQGAAGAWEVDAVVSTRMANLGIHDDSLQNLLDRQYPEAD